MTQTERRVRPLLGTFVEITLSPGNAAVFSEAFEKISHIHDLMSAHRADSELAKIALAAHLWPITVSPHTAQVIRHSLDIAQASSGAFDPVRAGVELVHSGRRPWFQDELPDRMATWRNLQIEGSLVHAALPLALDLGGVAKGYAVDLAAEIIAAHGCSGVVNAGGDLRFIGNEKRTAMVNRPEGKGRYFELSDLPFPALATTGSYAHAEGVRNLDLIDAANGVPIPADISITVFATNCMLADSMTKVVLNLPPAQAAEVLRHYECRALILESGGRFRELP